MLEEESSSVLTFQSIHQSDPADMDLCGPYAVCDIELKPNPEPKAVKPYRCVGICEAAFKALIEKFRDRGMLRAAQEDNPEWVSRAFVVPKPGVSGGW